MCFAVLHLYCCAGLCCVVLCCAVLCCAVLRFFCCAALCCAMLCSAVCCAMLCVVCMCFGLLGTVWNMCDLLQASKVVQAHEGLLDLQQQGLHIRDAEIPSPAVHQAQTCVVPFWTKPEHFHIFVRHFYSPRRSVILPRCICAVTGYFPVLLNFTRLFNLCLQIS